MRLQQLLAVLLTAVQMARSARILGLFPDMSRSHRSQNRPLFRALAARGHHVTMLSGFPETHPLNNYKDIVIECLTETADSLLDLPSMAANDGVEVVLNQIKYGELFREVMEQSFTSNGTQTLLRSNEKFDLIFVDITLSLFYLGFVPKFGNPPFIAIVPFGTNSFADLFAGNPDNPAFMPSILLPYSNHMSFTERLVNAVQYFNFKMFTHNMHFPNMDRHMRAHFGEAAPSTWEIAQNMSLLMVNTDFAHDYPRPLTPQTIEIGGLHLEPAKPLPQDLQDFLDQSTEGAILFSMGSVLRSDKLDAATLSAILGAFGSLRQRVLWKWESDSMPTLPPNVMTRHWLPQSDVLAHDNLKVFITHGGISSLEEAVYHGVPMVVIPVFADQYFQANKVVTRGIGVKVQFKSLSQKRLLGAIQEVLRNSSYVTNIERVRRVSRDKMATPLETAIFWTEYVLRHGGAQHLRTGAVRISWSQYMLLDVLAALLLTLLLPLGALVLLARRLAATVRDLGGTQRILVAFREKRALSEERWSKEL